MGSHIVHVQGKEVGTKVAEVAEVVAWVLARALAGWGKRALGQGIFLQHPLYNFQLLSICFVV
jgi:hypothetical protein